MCCKLYDFLMIVFKIEMPKIEMLNISNLLFVFIEIQSR